MWLLALKTAAALGAACDLEPTHSVTPCWKFTAPRVICLDRPTTITVATKASGNTPGTDVLDIVARVHDGSCVRVKAEGWHADMVCGGGAEPNETVTWKDTLTRYRKECRIPTTRLAVIVFSRRNDQEMRAIIRKTWGWQRKWLWFVVSATPCAAPVNDATKWECSRPGIESLVEEPDVANVASVESYRQLPHQLKLAYALVQKNVVADWILKIDLDSGSDLFRLQAELHKLHVADPGKMMVYGRVMTDPKQTGVHKRGKWADFKYPGTHWPTFPLGSYGHVLTRAASDQILDTNGIEYQGEDVSVGVWLKPHPVRWVHAVPKMRNDGRCLRKQSFVIGHDLKPRQILSCYARKGHLKRVLLGGLGNQLFQWASTVGIAQRTGRMPCFTFRNREDLRTAFPGIDLPQCPSASWTMYNEKKFGVYQDFNIPEHVAHAELGGYLQSWKYFAAVKSPRLGPDLAKAGHLLLKKHASARKPVCAIHARHGDLLKWEYVRFPPESYFVHALARSRCGTTLVFTDDEPWATAFRPFKDAVIVSEPRTEVAFAALILADTLITSVGTFSWWAGYLGKGTRPVYRPTKEFSATHKISAGNVKSEDYFYPQAIELSDEIPAGLPLTTATGATPYGKAVATDNHAAQIAVLDAQIAALQSQRDALTNDNAAPTAAAPPAPLVPAPAAIVTTRGRDKPKLDIDPKDRILQKGQWDGSPIVIEKYKLIFWTLPKNGCEEFKRLFRKMMGFANWKTHYNSPPTGGLPETTLPHNPATNGLKYLSGFSKERATSMFNDPRWTKAVFVRDPDTRFVSAYHDKIVKHQYRKKWLGYSFSEFVAKVEGGFKDPHWMPQCNTLDCRKWLPAMDFVGRIESVQEDTKVLLHRIGAWQDHGATGWGDAGDQPIFSTVRHSDHVSGAGAEPKELADPQMKARVDALMRKDHLIAAFTHLRHRSKHTV